MAGQGTETSGPATNVKMGVDRNLKTEPDVNGIDSGKGTVKLGGTE
jgi:hypothetical protein